MKLFALLSSTPCTGYSAAQLTPTPVRHDRSHPTDTITIHELQATNAGDAQHVRRKLTTFDLSAASRRLQFRTRALLFNDFFYPSTNSTQSQSQTPRDNTAFFGSPCAITNLHQKGKKTSLALPRSPRLVFAETLRPLIRDLLLNADSLSCVCSTARRGTAFQPQQTRTQAKRKPWEAENVSSRPSRSRFLGSAVGVGVGFQTHARHTLLASCLSTRATHHSATTNTLFSLHSPPPLCAWNTSS